MQQHDNLIAGEWWKGARCSLNLNPSNHSDTIAKYTQGNASHVEAAVTVAMAAFPA
jgi:aldehyde dehydrogenase (NAD+)